MAGKRFRIDREAIEKEALSATMEGRVRDEALFGKAHDVYLKLNDPSVPDDKPIQISPTIWKIQLKKLVYLMGDLHATTMGMAIAMCIDHCFENKVLANRRKAKPDAPKPQPKEGTGERQGGVFGYKSMGL